jgi:hypothetical protein
MIRSIRLIRSTLRRKSQTGRPVAIGARIGGRVRRSGLPGRVAREDRARHQHQRRPHESRHHAVSGVRPVARANRTSCVSRRISARATAVPKGVMR